MNSKQTSTYGMLRRVHAFFTKNFALLNGLPIFKSLYDAFGTKLNQIEITIEQQGKNISGLKRQKEILRSDLIAKALDVSRRVVAYAKLSDNEVLAKEAYYTVTDLLHYPDKKLSTSCSLIYTAAETNALLLAEYGVTEIILVALKKAIDDFIDSMDNPKKGAIEKTQNTKQLSLLFDEEMVVLGKIDLLIDILKITNPEVYNEYYSTRRIVYHSGSLSVKGKVTDAETGAPLEGVTVTFTFDGVVKLKKITSKGGGFVNKTLDEGTYTVTASRIDYIAQTMTINILSSEIYRLNIAMVKK